MIRHFRLLGKMHKRQYDKFYDAYILMCEGLPTLQKDWAPAIGDEIVLRIQKNSKIHTKDIYQVVAVSNEFSSKGKRQTMLSVQSLSTPDTSIKKINSSIRSTSKLYQSEVTAWYTWLPDSMALEVMLSKIYPNIYALNIDLQRCMKVYVDISMRYPIIGLRAILLILYAKAYTPLMWSSGKGRWVELLGKAKWFSLMKKIVREKLDNEELKFLPEEPYNTYYELGFTPDETYNKIFRR
jgi:hypothetical protein